MAAPRSAELNFDHDYEPIHVDFNPFDALGLDPARADLLGYAARRDRWNLQQLVSMHKRAAMRHVHPDGGHYRTRGFSFPNATQVNTAADALSTPSSYELLHKTWRLRHQSTWNPHAEINTDEARSAIPGQPVMPGLDLRSGQRLIGPSTHYHDVGEHHGEETPAGRVLTEQEGACLSVLWDGHQFTWRTDPDRFCAFTAPSPSLAIILETRLSYRVTYRRMTSIQPWFSILRSVNNLHPFIPNSALYFTSVNFNDQPTIAGSTEKTRIQVPAKLQVHCHDSTACSGTSRTSLSPLS
ncbi:MAG: hypothetical protein M1816_006220 [Peltula sp. TS41687]|nr:MAG: hypothetical protein M1816_006220 [Peltula sp. TS41687]